MMPSKVIGATMLRVPRALAATISASSAPRRAHHSDAGSAWAMLPQNVPRVRIGIMRDVRITLASRSPVGPATAPVQSRMAHARADAQRRRFDRERVQPRDPVDVDEMAAGARGETPSWARGSGRRR